MDLDPRTGVLFICMGNICRSPIAEGVFLHRINELGIANRFAVDSAGTGGWHAGETADPRALEVARKHGIVLPSRARQVQREDFSQFDHLICMDQANLDHILRMGAPDERASLLLDFNQNTHLAEVPDPYYGGPEGFETVFDLISVACDSLLDYLLQGLNG